MTSYCSFHVFSTVKLTIGVAVQTNDFDAAASGKNRKGGNHFSSKGVSVPTDPADPSCVLSDLLKRADIDIRSIVYASETWAHAQRVSQPGVSREQSGDRVGKVVQAYLRRWGGISWRSLHTITRSCGGFQVQHGFGSDICSVSIEYLYSRAHSGRAGFSSFVWGQRTHKTRRDII
jgi:hypothetical protein